MEVPGTVPNRSGVDRVWIQNRSGTVLNSSEVLEVSGTVPNRSGDISGTVPNRSANPK